MRIRTRIVVLIVLWASITLLLLFSGGGFVLAIPSPAMKDNPLALYLMLYGPTGLLALLIAWFFSGAIALAAGGADQDQRDKSDTRLSDEGHGEDESSLT